jgi:hypothetical protein
MVVWIFEHARWGWALNDVTRAVAEAGLLDAEELREVAGWLPGAPLLSGPRSTKILASSIQALSQRGGGSHTHRTE